MEKNSPFMFKGGEGINAGVGEVEWIISKDRQTYNVISSSAESATRRGFVPRQTPVKRKFSEEKIDNTDKNVCNQCHQAYWPRSKQGQETPNDATKVFKDIFIYCYHFQFCIFLVQIFQNELLEHGVVVFLWWAWSWGQPRTDGQTNEWTLVVVESISRLKKNCITWS